jgi:hypothetical protein
MYNLQKKLLDNINIQNKYSNNYINYKIRRASKRILNDSINIELDSEICIDILSIYSYIDSLINCPNSRKYDIEKYKGVFFIGLINNSNNILEYFNSLETELNRIGCKISISRDNYKFNIKSISYQIIKSNNLDNYRYFLTYLDANSEPVTKVLETSILQNNIIYKSNKPFHLLLLIYHILGLNTGLFWGFIPSTCLKIANKYNNNIIECFASPFNHTLDKFYSVLYSLDKDFGSLGNFFDRFLEDEYLINMMNPPWTEELIMRTFDIIKLKMKKHKCVIYLYIPQWDDINIPFYNQLKDICITYKTDLVSRKSYTYDYMNNKKIVCTFNTTIFLIHNLDDKIYYNDYQELLKNYSF